MTEKKATETTASALLEAVVSAELGLRDLEGTCASLEGLITQGRDLLTAAHAGAPAPPEALPVKPPAETEPPEVAESPAATDDAPVRGDAPDKVAAEEKPATRRSLEEQAAALRAAMGSVAKPAGAAADAKPAKAAKTDGKDPVPEKDHEASPLDRRPFLPKRTSPLRSRLAREEDGSPTPQEGESYSDRSAELEQLIRSEQNS